MYTGYLTREEFGVHLFDAIRLISGIHTMQQQMNGAVHYGKPETLPALKARAQELKGQLATQLPLLTEDEMGPILARYPDVVTL